MGDPIYGNLMFLHDLKEGGLRLGGGPVNFIRQDDLAHDGTGTVLHLPVQVGHSKSGNVGGGNVRGKLNAPEGTGKGPGKRGGQGGFSDPGDILNQQMALAEQGGEHELDHVVFSNDGLCNILL